MAKKLDGKLATENLNQTKKGSSSSSTSQTELEPTYPLEIGQRISHVRGGITQPSFSQMFNIHTNTLANYERGKRLPDAEFLKALCEKMSISPTWLLTGEGPKLASDNPSSTGEAVGIPLYNVTGSAGGGSLNDSEHVEKWIYCSPQFIHQVLGVPPKSLCMIHLAGNSMEPDLPNNSIVFVDRRSVTPNVDGIYVIRMDGVIMIKQLQRLPGGIIEVKSANTTYKSFKINPSDPPTDFVVLGRVICTFKKL